ncbi:MAG: hypothetical protein WCI87_09635 [Euryarchaeota archaeon]
MKNEMLNEVRIRRRFIDSALTDCGQAANEDGAVFAEVVRSPIFADVGSNDKAKYLLLWNHLRGLALDGKVRIFRNRNELRYLVNDSEKKEEAA